eukprot:TRINITY_DN14960_c0_g1_i1.p1 TRINITY_DN14960_c0_g1~~TRINITY_DN14960_c0_g1_i1.p1  ORF type:complete len:335 (+),score=32.38 TRINITY_DN14960_c0_g1_i1:73-1077(+)
MAKQWRPILILMSCASMLVIILIIQLFSYDAGNLLYFGSTISGAIGDIKQGRGSKMTFQLAYEQSFGYFDDIPQEHWERKQEIHAKLIPNHFGDLQANSNGPNDETNYPKLTRSRFLYAENFQEEFRCSMAQRVPTNSQSDGPKWICDPHRLRKKKKCLVYSFGCNGKAEFERGVKDEIGDNCEIHTFDVIKYNKYNGDFATAVKGYSTFHHWGLGTEEQAGQNPSSFKTLKQTMEILGHKGRTIDIFKIDCEWCEWFTFEQFLQQDLRQILVETHTAPMPNARDFVYKLHDAGFVIFNKEANYRRCGSVEYAFLKLSTDFFINGTTYKNKRPY